jgi:protein SCO1/2
MGIIRAEYRTPEIDPAILLRDIHFVAEEARRSTGAAKLAYEAAHLFMCYPR